MMRRRKLPSSAPVRSDEILNFFESYLRVPEGPQLGQPFKPLPFQVDYIQAIYDAPIPVRRAILSTAKKNGKSSLAAGLMLAHLVGPAARSNSQLFSTARNRSQASLTFDAAAQMINLDPTLTHATRILRSSKTIWCDERGSRFRALSADDRCPRRRSRSGARRGRRTVRGYRRR
jgi:phage terminase large subunit-like protein